MEEGLTMWEELASEGLDRVKGLGAPEEGLAAEEELATTEGPREN